MSLVGLEQVFERAIEVHLPEDLTIRVAPPIITTLLKIIAWVDDPYLHEALDHNFWLDQ